MKKILLFLCWLLLCAGLGSCGDGPVNPGEIAFVNGKAITLRQLQAAHDVLVLSGDNPGRDMNNLRKEYGDILADLIVQELINQELDRLHLAVGAEDIEAEENMVREDFQQPEEFERMLLEESVDVGLWRESLRNRVAVREFTEKVLLPKVSISEQELEQYARQHKEDFIMPERQHFIQVRGMSKEQIVAACEYFKAERDVAAVQNKFAELAVSEVLMRVDRLTPEQLAGLQKLKPLEYSRPVEFNGEFFSMILLGVREARPLTTTETYTIIENLLLEDKLNEAFNFWLSERLKNSHIMVSAHMQKDGTSAEKAGVALVEQVMKGVSAVKP